MTNKIKILKLTDSKTGHEKTTDSIINVFKSIYSTEKIEIVTIKINIRIKILNKLLKYICNKDCLLNKIIEMENALKFFYKYDKKLDKEYAIFDYVISSGGDTSFFNIIYGKKNNINNIYASQLRGLSNKLFYLIITTFEKDNYSNSILIDFPPLVNNIKRLNNNFLTLNSSEKNKKIFTLLIGGNGAGYNYTRQDFLRLVTGFNQLLENNNAVGLISTSRRTKITNEKIIKKFILEQKLSKIKYEIYFNIKPEYLLNDYLELSDVLFVTEDSGSMLTECILSNKDTYSLFPEEYKIDEFYTGFLNKVNKYIQNRVSINDLGNYDLKNVKNKKMVSIFDKLKEKLSKYIDYN